MPLLLLLMFIFVATVTYNLARRLTLAVQEDADMAWAEQFIADMRDES